MISWYLFSELRLPDFNFFFCLVSFLILNHVVFSPRILVMDVLSRHGDRESSHDTSVATSHVDHVVGLGIFSVSQVPSIGQYVVNLFFLFGEMKVVCFGGVFLYIVLSAV